MPPTINPYLATADQLEIFIKNQSVDILCAFCLVSTKSAMVAPPQNCCSNQLLRVSKGYCLLSCESHDKKTWT
ncbi:hypothetical protein MJO29_014460 [Puccinia striiformis f. sp. tritici]|nr:hypothetical protein MJO29_014460 [Puccinia striiformis f. sp. tritici]